MQAPLHASSIDFERMVGALRAAGYAGDLSLEYLWIAWEGLNECDTVLRRRSCCATGCSRPSTVAPGSIRSWPSDVAALPAPGL